ncbi:MAG: PD-(D/E)XK nuclease family protein [Legionella sp.]|jgi:probable DNA repair protein
MQYLNNKNKLIELMANGALLITPNNRLSSTLLQYYFEQSSSPTVDKPSCMPYATMLLHAYNKLKALNPTHIYPTLLNSTQTQHLWRTLLQKDSSCTYSDGLLKAVMQAWEYCLHWQIEPDNSAFNYTPQTQQFQIWWQTIHDFLDQHALICEQQLIPQLLSAKQNLFDKPVIWCCFDSITPQQKALQTHLNLQEIDHYFYDLPDAQTATQLFSAADTKQEYQQLISWLKLQLEQGKQNIGVVIPDLQDQARGVQRLMQAHFDSSVIDISLGQSLGEFPLIAQALMCLHIQEESITPNQSALLLQSPYIGNAQEEFLARSQFLQDNYLMQEPSLSLKQLIVELHKQAPKLAQILERIHPYPESAFINDWITLFQHRLNLLGFPGDSGLNSENYQCYNRFTAVFDEFRQLALITAQLTKTQALDAFTKLINNTIFQAQKTKAPIHICGLLEASGCEFDSLWVMGLTDNCLPQKVRLNAFIPTQMQRDLEMPHCLPAKELQFAQETLQRLRNGSKQVVFSYSELTGDNPNIPCALINSFPQMSRLELPTPTQEQITLIPITETYKLPLKIQETISGGTSLLANQAQCPFKAFAEHRLKAKPLPPANEGLGHLEKGQVIHKIMELIWTSVGTQEQLIQLSADALDALIETSIHKALREINFISHIIQEIELIRLKRLVLSCLDWEKQREAFSICALEQSYKITLAGLEFKVRVDRLDQVGDNKWLIDYKSSLPSSKPWNEERPLEPQLLLYALLDEKINTLLLVQLKTGQFSCSGFSEEKHNNKGISTIKNTSWEECKTTWRQQLTLLAEEFQQGHCPPQPANPSICHHCDFNNLCRI